jgi:hypothetical protein
MKAKWLLGASLALLGAGYLAIAQDAQPPAKQPPPPARNDNQPPPRPNDNQDPPPVQDRQTQTERRGFQVEVQTDRSASAPRPTSFYRAKQVIGARVSIEGGLAVGTVEDIVFADDGVIEYMVVANEGKLVSVPWAAAKFNFEQRSAVVGISQERFQQVPTFTTDNWPRFGDPQYRASTNRYYNVPVRAYTPKQERRMERRGEPKRRP